VSHHQKLVIGDGKGRGGKYQIHPFLQNYLTAPIYYSKFNEIRKPNSLSDNIDAFGLIDWRWLSCFSLNDFLNLII
jgi:hypothetical protein